MVFKALLFITDILIFGYQPEGRHVHKGEFQLTHNIETRLCRLRLTFQIKQSICIFSHCYISGAGFNAMRWKALLVRIERDLGASECT